MPQTWQKARDSYLYPVRLGDFEGHRTDHRWFEYDTGNGDRYRTKEFEDRFRKLAPDHLKAWYEVVFWKMYSQKGRRDRIAREAIANIKKSGLTAGDLSDLCQNYIGRPSSRSFKDFQKHLFDSGVAIAATFPAFVRPERFPMVDSRIANWAKENSHEHIYKLRRGNVMLPTSSNIKSIDKFVLPWCEWCHFTASILSQRTGEHWRARDVEMAIFTAQGKGLPLNPLR